MRGSKAIVYFRDGRSREVSLAQGNAIDAILKGEKMPEDNQVQFIANVKRVVFKKGDPYRKGGRPVERKSSLPQDDTIKKIVTNKKLSGAEKARAVADYIRSRRNDK